MGCFNEDLEIGIDAEKLILSIIQDKYPCAIRAEGYNPEYDIFVPEINIRVEVKKDFKSNCTGNFVVEIEMFGKPSALMTTKSDYWVFYDGVELFWIKPTDLRNLIMWNEYKPVRFVGNGDTDEKRAYLIKKDMIRSHSEVRAVPPKLQKQIAPVVHPSEELPLIPPAPACQATLHP